MYKIFHTKKMCLSSLYYTLCFCCMAHIAIVLLHHAREEMYWISLWKLRRKIKILKFSPLRLPFFMKFLHFMNLYFKRLRLHFLSYERGFCLLKITWKFIIFWCVPLEDAWWIFLELCHGMKSGKFIIRKIRMN